MTVLRRKAGWYVEIIEAATYTVEHAFGPFASLRAAEKAQSGRNRNLNHAQYCTRLVEVPR